MSSETSTAPRHRHGRGSVELCASSEFSIKLSKFDMLASGGDETCLSCRSSIVDLLRASGGLFELLDEPFPGVHLPLPRHFRYPFPLHHLGLQKLYSPRAFVDLENNTQHTPHTTRRTVQTCDTRAFRENYCREEGGAPAMLTPGLSHERKGAEEKGQIL